MGYSNSPLVAYTKLSPNHSGLRNHSIDRITPHCVVGQCSVETLGEIFSPIERQASSNYGIGADGRVGMYVEECNRSWCSSNGVNDNHAVTIECASDAQEPYAFNNVVYAKLIDLCVDICKRNGKTKLIWIPDQGKALGYNLASNEMLLTVHRWFALKSCPGDWMYARMGDLASKVTARLNGAQPTPDPKPEPEPVPYDKTCHIDGLDMPVLVYNPAIKSTYVKIAQEMLISKNYACGAPGADGYFGKGTLQAVKNFREENDLPDREDIDASFWKKLLSI